MHSRAIFGLVLVGFAATIAGCANESDDNSTNLRFLNAAVGVGSVDMFVDSDEYLQNVEYLESTAYLEFDTEPHVLQVTPSNSLTPIDTQRVTLQDDVDYTYIACGDSRESEAILLKDDTEPAGDNAYKARVINVFKGGRGFDVYITTTPEAIDEIQPAVRNIGYRAASNYRAARSDTYDIIVRNSATRLIVATLTNQNFESENVYSILLVADEENSEQVRVLVLTDRDVG